MRYNYLKKFIIIIILVVVSETRNEEKIYIKHHTLFTNNVNIITRNNEIIL